VTLNISSLPVAEVVVETAAAVAAVAVFWPRPQLLRPDLTPSLSVPVVPAARRPRLEHRRAATRLSAVRRRSAVVVVDHATGRRPGLLAARAAVAAVALFRLERKASELQDKEMMAAMGLAPSRMLAAVAAERARQERMERLRSAAQAGPAQLVLSLAHR
jgi:hypothetical protein